MPILAAASAQPIATLDEAKSFVNIDATNTDHDAELQPMLDAACEQVEERCEPVVLRTFTETYPGDSRRVVSLWRHRIQSITSLTLVSDGSSPLDLSDVVFDSDGGIIFTKSGSAFPGNRWQITYTAGFPAIPASLKEAALVITKQLWQTQRGNAGRPGVFGDATEGRMSTTQATYVYTGYALPGRAIELMEPYTTRDVA